MDRALVVGCRIAAGPAGSGRPGAQRKFQQALNHQSGFRRLRRQICYGFVSGGSIPFWMNWRPLEGGQRPWRLTTMKGVLAGGKTAVTAPMLGHLIRG
jgi:hypothetical protein